MDADASIESKVAVQCDMNVTQSCSTSKCADYAISFFSKAVEGDLRPYILSFHARGRAISKLVTVVEVVKERCQRGNKVQFEQSNRIWRDEEKSLVEFKLTARRHT